MLGFVRLRYAREAIATQTPERVFKVETSASVATGRSYTIVWIVLAPVSRESRLASAREAVESGSARLQRNTSVEEEVVIMRSNLLENIRTWLK